MGINLTEPTTIKSSKYTHTDTIETPLSPTPKAGFNREDYMEEFKKITDEMVELTRKKNNDYGGETDPWKNFREFGELGIIVRMSDKWARIKSALFEKRHLQVADETVEDTIKDLAVYSIILLIWRRVNGKGGN